MTNKEKPKSFIELDLMKTYSDLEFGLNSAVITTKNSSYIREHKTYLQLYRELKEKLEKEDYHVISVRENALLRLFSGMNSFVSLNSNWTKESILFLPGKEFYLISENPLIEYPNKNELEEIIAKSVKIKPNWGKSWENHQSYTIPTNRLGEDQTTNTLLQDIAKPYGEFLADQGFKEFSINLNHGEIKFPNILPVAFHGFQEHNHPSNWKFYKSDSDISTNGTAYTLRGIKGNLLDKDQFKRFARYLGFVHETDIDKDLEQAKEHLTMVQKRLSGK